MRASKLIAELFGAVAISLAAALWLLYPAYLEWDHAVVGDWRHPDMISNHWLYRWVSDRLWAGESLLHNDQYYFPVGDAPWLAGNGSDAVPYSLLAGVMAWPGSVTAWCLGIISLNGVSAWALARSRGARAPGAWFAAGAMALCPYVAHEMMGMRLSQAPLYWFTFFLASWMLLLEADRPRARWGWAVVSGLLFSATAFTYWYYGLWAALIGAILFAFQPRWRSLWAFLPVALVGTLPPLWLFLSHWSSIPGTAELLFPHPLSIESSLSITWPVWSGSVDRAEVVAPLSLTAGAAWMCLRAWKTQSLQWWMRGLMVVATVFGLLALGPELRLPDGSSSGVPGPFRLVYGLGGPLQRFWWPYRHVVGVLLAAVPLAALAVDAVVEDLRPHMGRWRAAVLVSLGAVAVLPFELNARGGRLDVPTSWFEAPPAYEALAKLPGEAIFELPATPRLATSQQTLSYQWAHGHKLVNGHAMWVDRVRPREWDAFVADNTFLARLQQLERGELFGTFAFKPEDVVALREAGVRHLVVNAEYFPKALYGLVPTYQQVFNPLFGPPVFQFRDQLMAWDLERYTFAGMVTAPAFGLPREYLDADGSAMLDLGYNRPQGWRTVARLFPPVIPPRGEESAGGDGAIAPHQDAR